MHVFELWEEQLLTNNNKDKNKNLDTGDRRMEWFAAHPPFGCVTREPVLILLPGCMEFHPVGMTTSSPPFSLPVSQDGGCALCEAASVFPQRTFQQTGPHRLLKPGRLLHPEKKGAGGGGGLRLVARGPRAALVLVSWVLRPVSSQREDGALSEIRRDV